MTIFYDTHLLINIIRGYNIDSRYRKLDVHCTVAKTGVRITMSREKGV